MISRLSLKYRIALVILLLEGIMMTVVLWQTLGLSLRSAAEQSSLTHDMLVELISDLGRSALLTTEYADLQLYLEHVQREPTVEKIFVTDIDRQVVAGIPPTVVGSQLPELMNTRLHFWRVESIATQGGSLGSLVVLFSNEVLESTNARVRNVGILIAVVGMLVIAIVGVITGFALTRKLDRISKAAQRFAHGELEVQTGVSGRDELAALGHTIDAMIRAVAEGQRRLTERGEQVQLLLQSTAEAIFGLDRAGICTFVNPACVQMLGYENEEELIGEPMHTLIHHSYPDGSPYPEEKCPIIQSFSLGAAKHAETEMFWRKDGSGVPVEYWAHPVMRQGRLIGSVVTFIDITERRQTEAELAKHRKHLEELVEERTAELTRINKELETFAYSVSHDLRSPLRAIDGFSLALLEDYADQLDETAKGYMQRVRAATQRMAELIDDLLQLSRITRSELNPETVDLSQLAGDTIERLRQQDADRQVDVTVEPGLRGQADYNLMRVAMDNLLGNAWKYTSRNPQARIEFGATQNEGETVYHVRDNGAGFDMQYADKLFGTFQRLHGESEYPGTGIGLATVQRIIQLHGGHIWGEGQVDQGATFSFTLGNTGPGRKDQNRG